MSEEVVEEKPKAKRATKKVAETLPVENSSIEESENVSENEEGQKVIVGPKKVRPARRSNSFVTEEGAIGSRAADAALAKKTNTVVEENALSKEKVAIWSDKNIHWAGTGHLSKGYNIVTREAADKWLKKSGIRNATAEEVATYYGK